MEEANLCLYLNDIHHIFYNLGIIFVGGDTRAMEINVDMLLNAKTKFTERERHQNVVTNFTHRCKQ